MAFSAKATTVAANPAAVLDVSAAAFKAVLGTRQALSTAVPAGFPKLGPSSPSASTYPQNGP